MHHTKTALPAADVFIHCGDALSRGTAYELDNFLSWLESLVYKAIIYVPGNHDIAVQALYKNGKHRHAAANIHILIDEEVVIDGVKFYGSPWTPKFLDWAFMKEDKDLKEHWDKIPHDTDVLITHCPAYGILDKNGNGQHCGSKTLMDYFKSSSPASIHFHGHLHESYGIEHNNTLHFNTSVCDGEYRPVNLPLLLSIRTPSSP
jgi:Icc-related predicted phosphoesterase